MQARFNPADVILPEGAKLGSYVVRAPIARGGMAAVYRAEHSWSGHEVALKCVKLPREPEVGSRFRREAIALAQTSGENLVHYFDGNETDGGVMWIAMELMASNLRDEIYTRWKAEGTGLPVARALDIAEGIARGLDTLHGRRILHRDIKPENVGFASDGTVKVLDFGLVKFLDRVFQTTDVSLVPGTPAYMAPEQLTGEELSAATDIYALGMTLYEMLAGLHPFALDELNRLPPEVAFQQQTREIASFPGLPKPLFRLIRRMTEKSSHDRIDSASALLRELAQIRRALSVQRVLKRSLTGQPAPYDGSTPGVSEPKLVLLRSFAVGGALAAAGVLAIVSLPRLHGQADAVAAPELLPQSKPPSSPAVSLPRTEVRVPTSQRETLTRKESTELESAQNTANKNTQLEPSRAAASSPKSRDSSPASSKKPTKHLADSKKASADEYPWPVFFKSKTSGKETTDDSNEAEPVLLLE